MNSGEELGTEKAFLMDVGIGQVNVQSILMDGYEYAFNRYMGDAQKWKCVIPSCYAYFKIMENRLLPVIMKHNHPANNNNSVDKIEDGLERSVSEDAGRGRKRTSSLESLESQPGSSRQEPPIIYEPKKKVKLPSGKSVMRRASSSSTQSDESRQHIAGSPAEQCAASPLSQNAASPTYQPKASPAYQPIFSPAYQCSASPSPAYQPIFSPAYQYSASPHCLYEAPLAIRPKSPKLSEIGPPLSPPLSRTSSQHDSDLCSPPIQVIDLAEAQQYIAAIPSQPKTKEVEYSTSSPTAQPKTSQQRSAAIRAKLARKLRYHEFERAIMKLDNANFGSAVASLLEAMPLKDSEDMRYEIATLLFEAVDPPVKP